MLYALYGHPKAGDCWGTHLSSILRRYGLQSIEGWPGFYYRTVFKNGARKSVMIVTYVDDLIMVGIDLIPGLLQALRAEIEMENPHAIQKYLGAQHKFRHDKHVTTIGWDMSSFLLTACKCFEDTTGIKLKPSATPYASALNKEAMDANLAAPGKLQEVAASTLMRLLYPGRMAVPTLVLAIQRLAKRITKWCLECDRRLVRLMEYVLFSAHDRLEGSLSSDDALSVELHVYPDADLNGNFWDTKSTAGLWIELAGQGGRCWPITWGSKAEPASAGHTQEAEMVSLSLALCNEACPLQLMLSTLLARPVTVRVFEDNSATITAAEKGYSPSLRHLPRHQRVALGTVHEMFYLDEDATQEERDSKKHNDETLGQLILEHKETVLHKGDFFTKELDRTAFEAAKEKMGMRVHPRTC